MILCHLDELRVKSTQESQSMHQADVHMIVSSKLDLRSVDILQCVSVQLAKSIATLRSCQHWWYLRAQHLANYNLKPRLNCNWSNTFLHLRHALTYKNPLTDGGVLPPWVIEVLMELGYDPTTNDLLLLKNACLVGREDVVRLLLSEDRVRNSLTSSIVQHIARVANPKITELVRQALG